MLNSKSAKRNYPRNMLNSEKCTEVIKGQWPDLTLRWHWHLPQWLGPTSFHMFERFKPRKDCKRADNVSRHTRNRDSGQTWPQTWPNIWCVRRGTFHVESVEYSMRAEHSRRLAVQRDTPPNAARGIFQGTVNIPCSPNARIVSRNRPQVKGHLGQGHEIFRLCQHEGAKVSSRSDSW